MGLHRVLRRVVERFNAQALFDPAEKQFHMPSARYSSKGYVAIEVASGGNRDLREIRVDRQS